MKTLKQRDPLRLRQSPSSGAAYFLVVLTLGALASAIAFFVIYSMSGRGSTMKSYGSDLEEWSSNDLANKFS